MQGYNAGFAKVYNLRWSGFAHNAAPRIRAYYEGSTIGQHNRSLLDLCCGTGQLALDFLDNGYRVTGLDLSADMLDYARAKAAAYIVAGQARFVQGDAAKFSLDERFGLVVSTYDALNHLPDISALQSCFSSVYTVLETGGVFLFDLNTPYGLSRWTGVSLEDTPEVMLVIRSIWDASTRRALARISGFLPAENGLYERFEQTAYNTAFDLAPVKESLLQTGFKGVRFARLQDLHTAAADPDQEPRIFIIAEK